MSCYFVHNDVEFASRVGNWLKRKFRVSAATAVEADSDSSEGELEESTKGEVAVAEGEAAKKKKMGFRDRKVFRYL